MFTIWSGVVEYSSLAFEFGGARQADRRPDEPLSELLNISFKLAINFGAEAAIQDLRTTWIGRRLYLSYPYSRDQNASE